ncbi:hypothetical protein MHH52_14105 [Paenibacillus sp. FSL K6-0276]|uniref:hypothetical protein n=1 Tax=Paenibacillus sp. FSL K6-0276 TaxID=2921450 RepID=UPI0030EC7FAC
MWKLKNYLRPNWVWSVLAPLMMLVEVSMDPLQPTLMASIVDHGIMTKDLSHIYSNGLTMLGVAFIGLIGGVGCTVFSSIASLNFGNDLRISPTLTLVVTVPLLVVILYENAGQIRWGNTVLQENLSGIRVVKAFVRAKHEQR